MLQLRAAEALSRAAGTSLVTLLHPARAPTSALAHQRLIASLADAPGRGMVLVFQLWGGPHKLMWWLDAMTGCTGDCPPSARVVYNDVTID